MRPQTISGPISQRQVGRVGKESVVDKDCICVLSHVDTEPLWSGDEKEDVIDGVESCEKEKGCCGPGETVDLEISSFIGNCCWKGICETV